MKVCVVCEKVEGKLESPRGTIIGALKIYPCAKVHNVFCIISGTVLLREGAQRLLHNKW